LRTVLGSAAAPAQERLALRRRTGLTGSRATCGAASGVSGVPVLTQPREFRPVSRDRRPLTPHWATRQSASATIARLILLAPRVRSTKLIGTSVTVSPARM